jgi:hypothetical protein
MKSDVPQQKPGIWLRELNTTSKELKARLWPGKVKDIARIGLPLYHIYATMKGQWEL